VILIVILKQYYRVVLCSYSDAEVLLTVQMDFASISRVISSYCIYCEIFL